MSQELTPTAEQQAIMSFCKTRPDESVIISALAGSAKTTTLTMLDFPESRRTIALAFNRLSKDDLREKLPAHVECKTLNALGHGIWMKIPRNRVQVSSRKTFKILKGMKDLPSDLPWSDAIRAVGAAKTAGLVPKGTKPASRPLVPDSTQTWLQLMRRYEFDITISLLPLLRKVLLQSIQESFAGLLDFADQLYMPVCFYASYPAYHTVLVDEAQDLSPIQHKMVELINPTRVIAVGDPKQAIYAWRGACTNSMELFQEQLHAQEFPLTMCFRCSKAVVKEAKKVRVPEMQWGPSAPRGSVESWPSWSPEQLQALGNCTVICRNNAPLFKLAFHLIRHSVSAQILGNDLQRILQGLLTKILGKKAKRSLPVAQVRAKLSAWKTEQIELAEKTKSRWMLARAEDRVACFEAIISSTDCLSYGDILAGLDALFCNASAQVLCTTGHRAKGREWETVIHLDPWRIPSKYAVKAAREGNDTQMIQETNLRYVITTRAKVRLIKFNYKDGERL